MSPTAKPQLVAEGSPSKQFFVSMITKDITLEDCLLDLLDNSIDGAQRAAGTSKSLKSYWAHLTLSGDRFAIEDNCEGIPVEVARTYAFHFGRPENREERILKNGIGLYGIGMKRAVFKLGNKVTVKSSTQRAGFTVEFEVDEWAGRKDWDFPMELLAKPGRVGTRIEVEEPNVGVGEALGSLSFQHRLERTIQRDYVRFLERGFVVTVNRRPIKARPLHVLASKDGIVPARKRFSIQFGEKKVFVDVIAGMMQMPPESADDDASKKVLPEEWGWYVLCNDRVVLAGDRSARTGWGTDGVGVWHPQYNGFVGWTRITSSDPELLPWSTTKREMDATSIVYRDALATMREFTKQFTLYTGQRKRRPEATAAAEKRLKAVKLDDVPSSPAFVYPKPTKAAPSTRGLLTIKYSVTKTEFADAIDALGEGDLEAPEVGRRTFDYFMKNEVGE